MTNEEFQKLVMEKLTKLDQLEEGQKQIIERLDSLEGDVLSIRKDTSTIKKEIRYM